mmetsp:Transcript_3445/g.14193  ORF Transcript_3445/g.14193 Transcript_3445/m.14193 type:complete len:410 (-) Transcript_3445:1038-2267(-)
MLLLLLLEVKEELLVEGVVPRGEGQVGRAGSRERCCRRVVGHRQALKRTAQRGRRCSRRFDGVGPSACARCRCGRCGRRCRRVRVLGRAPVHGQVEALNVCEETRAELVVGRLGVAAEVRHTGGEAEADEVVVVAGVLPVEGAVAVLAGMVPRVALRQRHLLAGVVRLEVRFPGAGRGEGPLAHGAGVVPDASVGLPHVRVARARRAEGHPAVGAAEDLVPLALVHRADVPVAVSRLGEHLSAVLAAELPEVLVHGANVPVAGPRLGEARGADVAAEGLDLLVHRLDVALQGALGGEVLAALGADGLARATAAAGAAGGREGRGGGGVVVGPAHGGGGEDRRSGCRCSRVLAGQGGEVSCGGHPEARAHAGGAASRGGGGRLRACSVDGGDCVSEGAAQRGSGSSCGCL